MTDTTIVRSQAISSSQGLHLVCAATGEEVDEETLGGEEIA
jgi:acetyl-CoA carboxylase carboxyltransferase component